MKLRTILYGYTFDNMYVPEPVESETVRSIYSSYIDGKTMSDIAKRLNDAHVRYSPDKDCWDKNMIYRILKDQRYVGGGLYPQIVSKDLFERVNNKDKNTSHEPLTEEIQWLKQKAFCHACGRQLYRRRMKDGSYRWLCLNGCIKSRPIRDKDLQEMILGKISELKEDPKSISVVAPDEPFVLSVEANMKNEIERLISEPNPSYQLVKSVVLESVSKRYECCTNIGLDEISNELISVVKQNTPGFELIKKICDRIAVDESGVVHLKLKNGKDYS